MAKPKVKIVERDINRRLKKKQQKFCGMFNDARKARHSFNLFRTLVKCLIS